MAHFDFVRPSGIWANEMAPGAQDWQRWDVTQSKSINADLGGATYRPKTPIVIGGAGMQLGTTSAILGGASTATGGRLSSAGPPVINDARSRVLVVPARSLSVRLVLLGANQRVDDYLARPSVSSWGISFLQVPNGVSFDIPRRYMHQGARLVSFAMQFVITRRPAALPATSMQLFPYGHTSGGAAYDFTPAPESMLSWTATHAYTLGTYVNPSSQAKNSGYYYKATVAGTTAGTEPTWPTVVGNTVTDGGVTWTCTGRNGWMATAGATSDSYYAGGGKQFIAYDTDPASSAGLNTMDNVSHSLSAVLTNPDPAVLITSMVLGYSHIVTTAFE